CEDRPLRRRPRSAAHVRLRRRADRLHSRARAGAPRSADPARHRFRYSVSVQPRARVLAKRRPRAVRGPPDAGVVTMAFDFYMPDIGEGVVEGEIVSWKVKEGDKVKLDQALVEVMTDKATVELPSPRAGTVKKLFFKEGDIAPVGKILVSIEEDGAAAASGNGKAGH